MPITSTKILLVEGENDKLFFKLFLKKLRPNLNIDVQVVTSQDVSLVKAFNTKQGVFQQVPWLLKPGGDSIPTLGIIVDADLICDGGGFESTLNQAVQILSGLSFDVNAVNLHGSGRVFKHSDGLSSCGLWITPNNADEGALENWLSDVVLNDCGNLLNHAKYIVSTLPKTLFRQKDTIKSELATWFAWLYSPNEGVVNLFNNKNGELIDLQSDNILHFLEWLDNLFADSE